MQELGTPIHRALPQPYTLAKARSEVFGVQLFARRSSSTKRSLRIMVVEDSDAVRAVLQHMVNKISGLSISNDCSTLTSAMTCLHDANPDIILLDIQLQGESGMPVLQATHLRHAATKVIVISNYADTSYRKHYMAAGAYAFFDKSHELKALRNLLENLVVESTDNRGCYAYQSQ